MADHALNRRRIAVFFEALNAKDVDAVMACYAPGAMIDVVAPGPFAGRQPASAEGLRAFFRMIPELRFEILGMLVEGDRVAVELSSSGRLANGQPYQNRYHDLFELVDGRIALFREYPTYPVPS